MPGPVIAKLIREELGNTPADIFASFDPVPLASASIGQAHAAALADGTDVVVKVRRPDVVEEIDEDLEIIRNLAAWAAREWEDAADYDLTGIAEEFSRTLRANWTI